MSWGTLRPFARDGTIATHRLSPGTWRRIIGFAAVYRRMLAALLVVIGLDAAIGAAGPLIYRQIINGGILGRQPRLVVVLALVLAGLAVAHAALSLLLRALSARVGHSTVCDLRCRLFDHVLALPIAFFTRTQTGAVVSRLNSDVLGVQNAFTGTLTTVAGNVVSLVFVMAAMISLSGPITFAALVLLPVLLLPARWMGGRLQAITRESYTLTAQLNATMTERFNVAGALLVKLFGWPADESREFQKRAGQVRDLRVRVATYGQLFYGSLALAGSLATAVVYGWGGVRAAQGALDVGTVIALAAYLQRLYGPLTSLSNIHIDVMTSLVSFDRVFEVLDLAPQITERADAVDLPAGPLAVEFDRVDFAYPAAGDVSLASLEAVPTLDGAAHHPVLFDVSFRIEPGQMVALAGPSGAGKTTISQLVSRLYDVDAGAVRLGGVDVRDLTLTSLRGAIGYVTQDAHLFHDTIRANLRYARPDATDDDLHEALWAAQIWPLVASLPDGLDTVVGDRGYRLSGGEKQRLAIARLLLKAPRVVVLDEATAHLDSESEQALQRALRTALAGRTALVIAHRLSTIHQADQILVVANGQIVESGRHAELLSHGGLYAQLYQTQYQQQRHQPHPALRAY